MSDFNVSGRQAGFVAPILLGRTLVLVVLVFVLLGLQYQYWYGKYGRKNLEILQERYELQAQKNQHQKQKIERLRADVQNLKDDTVAIEEHARADLGLIKSGEVFIQLSNAPVTPLVHEKSDSVEPDAVEILDVID